MAETRLAENARLRRDELLTLSLTDLTHEDDLLPTQASIAELLEGTRQQYDMQKRYRRKDGSVIWVNASGFRRARSDACNDSSWRSSKTSPTAS